jgi:undecaprenyl-diphosphatase
MSIIWAVFLGILQGLTEFLPVSSSGHLVIAQNLLPNFSQPGVLFDVVLHAGTTLSIVIFFRKRILRLTKKYLVLLLIGSIPAGVIGILFQDFFISLFSSTLLVGIALILTGLMNYLIDVVKTRREKVGVKDSFLVGIAQSIAIIPGISRSGATIFTGATLGFKRDKAAEFSFLLAIPAIFGANVLQLVKFNGSEKIDVDFYFVGFICALVSGYLAIKIVFKFLKTQRFRFFSLYCLVLGFIVIMLSI